MMYVIIILLVIGVLYVLIDRTLMSNKDKHIAKHAMIACAECEAYTPKEMMHTKEGKVFCNTKCMNAHYFN